MKEFLKLLTDRELYYRAKEEGLVPQWFDTEEERWFIKFLSILHESSKNGLSDIYKPMAHLADTYITDDEKRTKFLLLVESVALCEPSHDFETSLRLLKEKFLSKLLTYSVKKVATFLKEGNLDKAINIFRKSLSYLSDLPGKRTVYDLKEDSVHKEALSVSEGLKTGYLSIDNVTNGFRPGELIIIVSGFAEGKSTLLLNIGYNVFMSGKNVIYFSLEMPYTQIVRRIDSLSTGIPYLTLKTGNLDEKQQEKIANLVKYFRNVPNHFYIIDCPECTPQFIDSKVSSLGIKPDLIVIDYLSLVKSEISYKSLWESLNTIAVRVRSIGRKYNVPVLTAAQVRREAIERETEFYEAYDIALAFSLVQHADIVISMKIDDPDVLMAAPVCLLKCKFLKDRDGSRSSFLLRADFSTFKITEPTVETPK